MSSARIFATVEEAKAALRVADSAGGRAMCSVWFSAGFVFVATAAGTGKFTVDEWRRGGGPKPSVADDGPVSA